MEEEKKITIPKRQRLMMEFEQGSTQEKVELLKKYKFSSSFLYEQLDYIIGKQYDIYVLQILVEQQSLKDKTLRKIAEYIIPKGYYKDIWKAISRQELNEKFFMDYSHLVDLGALVNNYHQAHNSWLFKPELRTDRLKLYISMNNLEEEVTRYYHGYFH
jgi:hypothetical protein